MATFAQLLTGCLPGSSPAQHQQHAPISSLTHGKVATAYVQAAVRLLIASRQHEPACGCGLDSSSEVDSRSPAEVLQQGCWILGTQQHLLPLVQTLQQHSQHGTVLWAGYCVHLLQDTGSPAAGNSQDLGASVLNVLAFAPQLLPALWQWLARTAGLPLEAPLQATRGLDIAGVLLVVAHVLLAKAAAFTALYRQASVSGVVHSCRTLAVPAAAVARGPEGLPPAVALVMGLFCR
jgi:hypothetical protein